MPPRQNLAISLPELGYSYRGVVRPPSPPLSASGYEPPSGQPSAPPASNPYDVDVVPAMHRFTCECGYGTDLKRCFIDHRRIHSNERPYVCHCGAAFKRSSHLANHQKCEACRVRTQKLVAEGKVPASVAGRSLSLAKSGSSATSGVTRTTARARSVKSSLHPDARPWVCGCGCTFKWQHLLIFHQKGLSCLARRRAMMQPGGKVEQNRDRSASPGQPSTESAAGAPAQAAGAYKVQKIPHKGKPSQLPPMPAKKSSLPSFPITPPFQYQQNMPPMVVTTPLPSQHVGQPDPHMPGVYRPQDPQMFWPAPLTASEPGKSPPSFPRPASALPPLAGLVSGANNPTRSPHILKNPKSSGEPHGARSMPQLVDASRDLVQETLASWNSRI